MLFPTMQLKFGRYETVSWFMGILRSVSCHLGNSLYFNHSHLSGRPGGCHDLLVIAIGGMVADPILEAVVIVAASTDIYYGDARNIFALHIWGFFLMDYLFPNVGGCRYFF